jgi:hypothetical protein
VTGLADNFVERKVSVYLYDSALFPTVFVRPADKLSNVWPTVVKYIVCEINVDNVILESPTFVIYMKTSSLL